MIGYCKVRQTMSNWNEKLELQIGILTTLLDIETFSEHWMILTAMIYLIFVSAFKSTNRSHIKQVRLFLFTTKGYSAKYS